jgi:prepilin-type N-terminal cleavage/methylation domain-containing protein
MMKRNNYRGGFTMIELLTVIAIITILAAIIFPIFGTVRKNVSQTSCLTNLHSIAQAIKMYKDDYRVYPEALYGYMEPITSEERLPAEYIRYNKYISHTFLYPQYIPDRAGFRCPMNPERNTDEIEARLIRGINGVTGAWMGSSDVNYAWAYYAWDSYDGTRVPHTQSTAPYLVHYLRRWDPKLMGYGGNDPESTRQLLYRNPPDSTVVTWCTYHRNYRPDGTLESGSVDPTLFLDGRAKPVPSTLMVEDGQAHLVTPGI